MSYRFDTRGALLPKVLGVVIVLFFGILIATYVIAKQVNPVMLDDHGNVRGSQASQPR